MGSRSFAVVSVLVALSCGRTGLESDLVDPLGSGGIGTGGRRTGGTGGTSVGGSLSGGQGGSAASSATGGSGDAGGASGTTGGGGAVGGSQGGALGGGNGGAGGNGGTGGSSATGGVSSGGTSGAGMSGMAGISGLGGMAGMPSLECGDGIVGPEEMCDAGAEPSPPALELRQGDLRFEVLPIQGPDSPTAFYDYRSASSHTGFEAVGASRIYLYRWSLEQALSLVFHHGIDEDESGLVQPESHIIFEVSGLPTTGVVVLSDERAEFARTSGTAAGAEWEFRENTDGGIVGGLPLPGTWHLTVNAQFLAGFYEWTFLSGTGVADESASATHLLDMSQPIEIVSNGEPGSCRADCTVPTCGDGRLDPGEVCDDGNAASGDGCSACFPEF